MENRISSAAARLGHLATLEHTLVRDIARAVSARPVLATMRLASRYGDWGLSVTVGVLLLTHRGAQSMPTWLTMTGVALLIQHTLKRRWARIRPCQRPDGPPQRAPIPDPGSFPSGHTLHAVMGAVVISAQLPLLGPVFIVVAVVVATSRVVLGVHYPSDVLAGGALGGVFVAVVNLGLAA
jgi:undecaprenyl-diphosphatase